MIAIIKLTYETLKLLCGGEKTLQQHYKVYTSNDTPIYIYYSNCCQKC